MTNDTPAHLDQDALQHASELIERAIASISEGDHDSGMRDLADAEQIADDAGIEELVTAIRINQGWAHSLRGEGDAAIGYYTDAADRARASEDSARLSIALANLSAEFVGAERYDEAIATLTEYLALLGDGDVEQRVRALVNRGMAYARSGDFTAAFADLEAAEDLAVEAEDEALAYLARLNSGHAYLLNEDIQAALMQFDRAIASARQLKDKELLRDVLINSGQTNQSVGFALVASIELEEAEALCRETGNQELLAYTLYWHGRALDDMKRGKDAIEKWDEAASIRAELGQDGFRADCLLAMADVYRRKSDHAAAGPLFSEASEIYERLGLSEALGSAVYWHGMSLWSDGATEAALEKADRALGLALEHADDELECRSRGLRAMSLSDLDQHDAAIAELAEAERRCEEAGYSNLAVWMIARHAYVFARAGRPVDDVTEAITRAYTYGAEREQGAAAESALRRVRSLVKSRCPEEYRGPVGDLVDVLLAPPTEAAAGDLPPTAGFVPPVELPQTSAEEPVPGSSEASGDTEANPEAPGPDHSE